MCGRAARAAQAARQARTWTSSASTTAACRRSRRGAAPSGHAIPGELLPGPGAVGEVSSRARSAETRRRDEVVRARRASWAPDAGDSCGNADAGLGQPALVSSARRRARQRRCRPTRHHRVHHRVLVDVDEVERLAPSRPRCRRRGTAGPACSRWPRRPRPGCRRTSRSSSSAGGRPGWRGRRCYARRRPVRPGRAAPPSTARSSTHGTGGWCMARMVPSGAGVASSAASQSSCDSDSSPWW